MSFQTLSEPAWLPLDVASAVGRLEAAGVQLPVERHALVGWLLEESGGLVGRWLASKGLAFRKTRVEAQLCTDGDLVLSLPLRPIHSEDLEVEHGGEFLEGVRVYRAQEGSIARNEGFPSESITQQQGLFGSYDIGDSLESEIEVRFWAGYLESELPTDLRRAFWLTFKAAFEAEFRESDLAYKQGVKTAASYRKPASIPKEAEQILEDYRESMFRES